MPRISIIMAAYNQQSYIADSVKSMLNQTYNDFELIIINDGSNDNTLAIINDFNDKRIKVLKNEKNSGLIYSLNKGLANSLDCEYVARMDSDDIALPNRFLKQTAYMEQHPKVGLLGTNVRFFGDDVKLKKRYFVRHDTKKINSTLFCYNPIIHPTIMIRNSYLRQYDLKYESEFLKYEDYAFFIDTLGKFEMNNLNTVLLNYRRHSSNITNTYSQEYVKDFEMFSKILNRLNTNLNIGLTSFEIETLAVFSHKRRAIINEHISLVQLKEVIESILAKAPNEYFDENYLKQLLIESSVFYLIKCKRSKQIPEFLKSTKSYFQVIKAGVSLVEKYA